MSVMRKEDFMEQYRQGDFLFIRVDNVPQDTQEEKRVSGKAIVGYGEATGHHHAIAKRDVAIRTLDNVRWIEAPTGARITHQEHNTITLPAGNYRIVQERTYHAGKIQRVVD